MFLLRAAAVLCAVCSLASANPVRSDSDTSGLYYLMKYGYIQKDENSNTAALLSANGVKKAIKDFQAFAGLNQTGDLDKVTVKLMNTPRCGVTDIVGHGATARRRKKRYALQGSRWRTRNISYRITKYPSSTRLKKKSVDDQMRKAFELWSGVTNLDFEQKASGSVHIEIRFEYKEHGDGDPFDGPGGTLAHAYFPQYGGDAHFDDQELWTIDEFKGTNLLQTATHEIGHSLGLSHSDVNDALMAPFYRGWQPNLKLNKDDVEAVQALYGKKTDGDVTTTSTTRRPAAAKPNGGDDVDNGDLCDDGGKIDTIFSTADGSYYVFKGSQYWKLTDDSVDSGYPRRIRDDWPGLPNNIDAAVTWTENEMTYFFKGDEYWKFDNKEPSDDYPKKMGDGFTGVPDNIDSAFVWGGNGKIYFFKGDEYWKFDPSRKPPVRSVYPRPLTNWDLPADVGGAVKWKNGYTYFFHGDEYYRFNDRTFTLDEGSPSFPRNTGKWWFGCGKEAKAVVKNKEGSAIQLFEEEGDEGLDVFPGDE